MQKKFLVSVTAIATAFTMVAAPSITAFAIDSDPYPTPDPEPRTEILDVNNQNNVVENHDISVSDGVSAVDADNSSVTINGDINSTGSNGTTTDYVNDVHPTASPAVDANNSNVTVNGNIIAGKDGSEQNAIYASQNSTVTVNPQDPDSKAKVVGTADGIYADYSAVTVNGNVVGGQNGISSNNSTITVTGDVNTTGMQVNIYDSDSDSHEPIGVSYISDGIYASGTNSIHVDGNVYGLTNGVEINLGSANSNGKTTVYVGGTVIGGLNVHDNGNDSGLTKQNVLDLLPEVTVYELKDVNYNSYTPIYGTIKSLTDEENQEVRTKLLNSINYIIKSDSSILFNDDLDQDTLRTTNVGKSFTVKADISDNQYLDAGDNVYIKSNGDGTFTLTLTNNRGGINIRALLKPVPKDDANESSTTSYEVVVEEVSVPSYADTNQAPAGAIVVATAPAAAATPEIAAISGDKPARTVSYSLAEITPIQYKESVIQNVAAAPVSGAFNIETDRMSCFDTKMIEAFATRPDIDINVVFTYGGKKLKVTIPAGYNVRTLLDSNGYCGFLRLMALLGATELS